MVGCPAAALQGAVIAKLGEDRFGEPRLERGSDDQGLFPCRRLSFEAVGDLRGHRSLLSK